MIKIKVFAEVDLKHKSLLGLLWFARLGVYFAWSRLLQPWLMAYDMMITKSMLLLLLTMVCDFASVA